MGKKIKLRRVFGLTRYQFLLWALDGKTYAVNLVVLLCMIVPGLELRDILLRNMQTVSVWEMWLLVMSALNIRLILCVGFFLNTLDEIIPGQRQYVAMLRSEKLDYLIAIGLNCIAKCILYALFMFVGLSLVFIQTESSAWDWGQGMKLFCYSDPIALGIKITFDVKEAMLLTSAPFSAFWMQAGLLFLGTVCFSYFCASIQMIFGKAAGWLPIAAAVLLEEGIRMNLIPAQWKKISYFHFIDGQEVFWAGRFSDLSVTSSVIFLLVLGAAGVFLYSFCFLRRDISSK